MKLLLSNRIELADWTVSNTGDSSEFSENSNDRIVFVSHFVELLAVAVDNIFGHLGQEVVVIEPFAENRYLIAEQFEPLAEQVQPCVLADRGVQDRFENLLGHVDRSFAGYAYSYGVRWAGIDLDIAR